MMRSGHVRNCFDILKRDNGIVSDFKQLDILNTKFVLMTRLHFAKIH